MSRGLDMLREYIEHDALCISRRKCCRIEGVLMQEMDALKADNARLRELMRVMHGELVACEDNGYVCGGHKYDDRLRELGIEVE